MGGSEKASIFNDDTVRASPKSPTPIGSARRNRRTAENELIESEKRILFFIMALTVAFVDTSRFRLPIPRASDTRRVVARLIPDVARVSAKPYTLEISVKSPIATVPILFAR